MKESNLTWNEYKFHFQQKAIDFGIPQDRVDSLLLYSENLHQKGLPIIYDRRHLSFLTGYREEYLVRAAKNSENFYRHFKIAKKNGHSRSISEPLPGLKAIQYWILEHLFKKLEPNLLNNAYIEGRSIVTNAKYHTKQLKVLNIDIEKYFDNIKKDNIIDLIIELGYNQQVSTLIAELITLNGGLPQGSPTSPYLSSIITKSIDEELLSFCRAQGLRYSRYADDISISGNFTSDSVIKHVREVLTRNGFNMNSRKTTVKKNHQRQMVTGIVVNRRISIKKITLKLLRQEVYYIDKYGLENHIERKGITRRNYLNVLAGKLNYFTSVKKNCKDLEYISTVLKRIILKELIAQNVN